MFAKNIVVFNLGKLDSFKNQYVVEFVISEFIKPLVITDGLYIPY